MTLDVGAAKQAFAPIAEQLSVPLEEAADAAIQVANRISCGPFSASPLNVAKTLGATH